MDIAGNNIPTPHDDGIGVDYDPDWRRRVAIGWVENNRWFPPKHIYYDQGIRGYVEYLRLRRKMGSVMAGLKPCATRRVPDMPDRYKSIVDAEAWYLSPNGGVRGMVEPLLLSGVELKHAAADIVPTLMRKKATLAEQGRVLSALNAYEQLFFNIRDSEGLVNTSFYTRTKFALNGVELNDRTPEERMPYVMAAWLGYPGLMQYSHNLEYAHGKVEDERYRRNRLFCESQINMFSRILRKQYNNFDSVMLLGKNIEYEKMLFDTKAASSDKNAWKDFAQAIFEIKVPDLLGNALSVDERVENDKASMDMFFARKNIAEQATQDSGMSSTVQQWNESVKMNFEDHAR